MASPVLSVLFYVYIRLGPQAYAAGLAYQQGTLLLQLLSAWGACGLEGSDPVWVACITVPDSGCHRVQLLHAYCLLSSFVQYLSMLSHMLQIGRRTSAHQTQACHACALLTARSLGLS